MTENDLQIETPIVAEAIEPARPWGLWATVALSFALIGLFFLLNTIIIVGFVVAQALGNPHFGDEELMNLASSGFLFSVAEWVSAPLTLGAMVLLIKLKRGISLRAYLSLNQVSLKTYLVWLGIIAAFSFGSDGLSWLLDKPVVPEVMVKAYSTAVVPPLLWGAIVVVAPIFEELFFRGFFFLGIQRSRLGNVGAILITSFCWSIIHVQYNAAVIAWIFIIGIIFGIARAMTNSTYLTIALHVLLNLIATIQIEILLRR